MTDKATLRECPFCGGEAQVMHMDLDSIEEGWKVWGVWCVDDLNAEDYRSHGHYIDNYATEAEAIAAWNARAEQTCRNNKDKWSGLAKYLFVCSECGWNLADVGNDAIDISARLMKRCPNCGAKVIV